MTFKVPRLPLVGGRYNYSLACDVNGALADSVQNAGTFHVEGGDFYGSGKPLSADARSVSAGLLFRRGRQADGGGVTADPSMLRRPLIHEERVPRRSR